eukprot:SAG11_NODE_652_length_7925_cov_3.950166_14_plen_127_part_00
MMHSVGVQPYMPKQTGAEGPMFLTRAAQLLVCTAAAATPIVENTSGPNVLALQTQASSLGLISLDFSSQLDHICAVSSQSLRVAKLSREQGGDCTQSTMSVICYIRVLGNTWGTCMCTPVVPPLAR